MSAGAPVSACVQSVKPDLVVVLVDLVHLQALGPRIGEPLLRALEVVLDVALAADEAAHLLPGGHRVHVVVLHALARFQGADALEEARPGDAQRHRVRGVAIDARDGMREGLARLGIRHLVVVLEALDQVAVPGLLVGHVDRRVAVDAGARLLEVLHALGEGLVLEHVGVAALLAEIRGERVARPHRLQPRIFLEARLRHDGARVGLGGGPRHGLAAAVARPLLIHGPQVAVVLQRKVLSPDRGIDGVVGQLDDAEERVLRFPLPLHDVDEERRDRRGAELPSRPPRSGQRRDSTRACRLVSGQTRFTSVNRQRWSRRVPDGPRTRDSGYTRCRAIRRGRASPSPATTGSWQRRQFASAIARLAGSARIGSGNVPVVK